MKNCKVIGIGFHKTGTTTLGSCLRSLGYNHISYDKNAFLLYQQSEIEALLKLMEFYDSFEDWPWPFLYKEAYYRFPNSKFVLTTRVDEEIWFESLAKHVERGAGEGFKYRKYIYGYENPRDNKQIHVEKYLNHNQEVRDFFADKESSLLEICWERGDSWDKLCNFLDEPIPNVQLPHKNKRPNEHKVNVQLSRRVRRAVQILTKGS